ncbi:hypothetical protein [Croceicoccus mobilis]|uniref:Uncharacterized protein n=1 Tax=Croceicoccus mobilis TaxID=1703339 RepID=A0A917DVA1_9SPHN|nr:hypothetical protein [Croceicoccus mobilis]GGD73889.1 hypothetical protein GCM10010990_24390 [Croceicoccus mobilis]
MTTIRHLIAGFVGGEISPMLSGRVDLDIYPYALEKCENFVPVNEGPIVKAPGFEYIRDADDASRWLSAFRFSITQEYVLEWSEQKLRLFTNGGRIESAPGVPVEVAVPYAAAEAPFLSFQQSYDRLYIDHAGYAPAALLRTGATSFSHAYSALKNGPFLDQNTDEAKTVTVSATTGSGITITANSAIFEAGHVGALIEIEAKDYSDVPAWEPGMKGVSIGDKVRSDGKVYQAATAGTTGSVVPTHGEGAAWDGSNKNDLVNDKGPYGIKWTFLYERQGVVEITAVASGTSATGTVQKRLADSLTSVPSYRWAHQAFSNAQGWPSLVLHWAGRQIHVKDFDIVGSVVGDYGGGTVNFSARTNSGSVETDLAFRRTLSAEDPPLWIAGDRKAMILGTASRELAVSAVNPNAALSGENISAEPQSFYGSEQIAPVQVGAQTIFVERGGRRLRSANYDFSSDRYRADDITASARHITAGGLVQLAYQRIPYALVYAVRADGQLIVHPDTRLDMKGFARRVLGGDARALSAVSVVGADGKTDELWLLVERTRADGVKKEIWRQTAWRELGDDAADSFYVDGGVRIAATGGQTHFSGLVHLAGKSIAALRNGAVVNGLTVSSAGELDVPNAPADDYTLIVGLPYTATAITLPPERQLRDGTMQGRIQRLVKVVARVLETFGLKAGSPGGYDPQYLLDRNPADGMNAPVRLFSGDTSGPVDAQHDRKGQVIYTSADPLPAIIASTILKIDVDDRDA